MKKFHHFLLKGLFLWILLPLMQAKGNDTAFNPDRVTTSDTAEVVNDSMIRLSDALKLIKTHFEVDILFEDKTINGLTVPANRIDFNKTAEENLANLLSTFPLTYKKVKARSYLVIADRKKSQKVTAAAITRSTDVPSAGNGPVANPVHAISGTVTSSDGQPLQGASVKIKGSDKGTTTDADGRFKLAVDDGDAIVVISYTGYSSAEISLKDQSDLIVKLTRTSGQLMMS
jgi:hypothetical protein